ncbi:MAG: transcription antitermination factor NusB [Holosporales bacterium]|jgi:N utilization substance protein B|nr:transcription antitermination factor NusB [Holosporales bacterium]
MVSGDTAKKAGIRGIARLAAIQALYQQEQQQQTIDEILEEFLFYRAGTPVIGEEVHSGDKVFFTALMKGVITEAAAIDGFIIERLTEEWTLERLDPVVRAILRAGICELLTFKKVPACVVLNEYVELTKAFFDEKEPMFVNGVLHSVAKILRSQEISEKDGKTFLKEQKS